MQELNEQIKTYKAELTDKQREFQHEKQELQKVIEEQRDQIKKGGGDSSGPPPAEVEALNKDLQKAKQEVKEAAVERERFQSQLEMLVQELEQKQVGVENIFFKPKAARFYLVLFIFINADFIFISIHPVPVLLPTKR